MRHSRAATSCRVEAPPKVLRHQHQAEKKTHQAAAAGAIQPSKHFINCHQRLFPRTKRTQEQVINGGMLLENLKAKTDECFQKRSKCCRNYCGWNYFPWTGLCGSDQLQKEVI